jgi:hypothetical protein
MGENRDEDLICRWEKIEGGAGFARLEEENKKLNCR